MKGKGTISQGALDALKSRGTIQGQATFGESDEKHEIEKHQEKKEKIELNENRMLT